MKVSELRKILAEEEEMWAAHKAEQKDKENERTRIESAQRRMDHYWSSRHSPRGVQSDGGDRVSVESAEPNPVFTQPITRTLDRIPSAAEAVVQEGPIEQRLTEVEIPFRWVTDDLGNLRKQYADHDSTYKIHIG